MNLKLQLFAALLLLAFNPAFSQDRVSPAVPGFGGIYEIESPDEKPDPSLEYNIVIDVTMGSDSANAVNPSLHNIARMMNLHVAAGVPLKNMHVKAVIHSKAIAAVLDNKHHKEKFEVDNPNIDLIGALKKSGVEIYVCAQSLLARNYEREWVNKDIGISYSALTLLTTYQLKGYSLLKF
ncbi:DsrE family protein [Chondrinema litorale]|uniref:DsrE family protein n=1 Tax=Chondrinema litorale TaxID=2994555 RepID=UPI002542EEC3|nr:DsrE family protein [Chondrinema litorale]UZR94155.1 DsrE family protein [Chondrinema litorale]